MSIRLKVFVIILGLFALMGAAGFLIQRFTIFPSFLELEYREAGENLHRIFYAIDREVVHLDRLCHDWAAWDDAYEFMEQQSQAFIASNLNAETLASDHLNLLLFCRTDGTIVWGAGTQNERQLAFPFLQTKKLFRQHPLLALPASNGAQSVSGLIDTSFGPLLFSTQTILHSDGSGPEKGFLVMGRLLDRTIMETLKEQTRITFELIYPLTGKEAACRSIDQALAGRHDNPGFFAVNNGKHVKICAGYPDITGKQVFGIQYLIPREITQEGITSIGSAAALFLASGLLILIILNLVLQQVILRPIQHLTDQATAIEQAKDFSRHIVMQRRDEIGKLAYSLESMVRTIEAQTSELQLANEQLIILTLQDGLTGIANRRMFDSYLNKEWRRAMREQNPLSLILVDVDFFKNYNDTYGHQQGDRCLIALAETMQKKIRRPADLAARYGGEEFALILPNTHEEGAMIIAERVRRGVEDLNLAHSDSQAAPYVTISLGLASTVPRMDPNNHGINAFVETADRGLYQAKQQGRNRTVKAE